jgi:hypothetical protein
MPHRAINSQTQVKGSPVTVSATGSVDETVTAGTYEIVVSYLGIPLYDKKGDLCSLQKTLCPIAQGPLNISKTVNLPSWVPSGAYHLKLDGNDMNSQLLLCVEADLNI